MFVSTIFTFFLKENSDFLKLNQTIRRVFFAINFSSMAVSFATTYFPEYMKARFSAGLIFKMANEVPLIDSCSKEGAKPVRSSF
jgi:hypothetical protein